MSDSPPLVALTGIVKTYGSVRALSEARFDLRAGEIHGLLGENGAGKTTMARVMAGAVAPDRGQLTISGKPTRLDNPADARSRGIAMVHQHFSLVPRFTGLENVALSAPQAWTSRGRGRDLFRDEVTIQSEDLGLHVELDVPVEHLGIGDRQRIEILKALVTEPRILILDEPTAVLTPQEVERLFRVLRKLASSGTGIVLVAHKLDEVLAIADRVTILRQGAWVFTRRSQELSAPLVAQAMVTGGQSMADDLLHEGETRRLGGGPTGDREVVVSLREVSTPSFESGPGIQDLSLSVARGEIVGVAGVEGNGQRELAALLAGLVKPSSGTAKIPERIGYIPQDRNREGLIPEFTISENLALALHEDPDYRRGVFFHWNRVGRLAESLIADLNVQTTGPGARAESLSGGNQQKVLTGRELMRSRDLLVAENPTRGLDIGATAAVRSRLAKLVDDADLPPGVVLISTDLDEILELSDRVVVLVRGRLIAVPTGQLTPSRIGRIMLGGQT